MALTLPQVDPDNQPIPNPNRTFSQFLHFIAPGMTVSGLADSEGFRQLVNTTPAIIDYLGPGAKTGSPLHRSFNVELSTNFQICAVTLSSAGKFFHTKYTCSYYPYGLQYHSVPECCWS